MDRNSFEDFVHDGVNGLSLTEAETIYTDMYDRLDLTDEDVYEIWTDMIERANVYANMRASWLLKTREEKMLDDDERTSLHNRFINIIDQIAFIQEKQALKAAWRDMLGQDRRRIGDFACYVSLFWALNAR